MSMEILSALLGWSALINYIVLLIWAGFILFGRQFVYRLHGSFFKLSNEQFDMIHYTAMAAYKLLILVFNLVPFVVLQFIV
ncbi:MAG: hypothetical protein CMP91_00735 [Gammaproteobacteria bacterium]|mgnify:FL=1|nr:hypothetical protein [Gammaproteobacteria bacterium]MAY01740.1 hypothetical protein [Gammaproteobacteria bacterium]